VVLANGRYKCGLCEFGGPTERVHLVGVSISFEKNFYQLPFTPPLSGRLIGLSLSNLVSETSKEKIYVGTVFVSTYTITVAMRMMIV
jgi:hypothetical protein